MAELLYNINMAEHCTMRVGGIAAISCFPESERELSDIIERCGNSGLPFETVGNGSNVIFVDPVYRGCVIFTSRMTSYEFDGDELTAYAGASLTTLSHEAAERGLSGLEFAYGIPGTVGGAVFMNAGAYGGEIADVFESCVCIDTAGKAYEISMRQMDFGYRHSALQGCKDVICKVRLKLAHGDKDAIKEKMNANMEARRSKQPLNLPSCGSAFKRPEGHYAGALIEGAGLKGYSVGGAQVSPKHAGFIVNTGDATVDDILMLISKVQNHVFINSGVWLEPEIRFVKNNVIQ